MAAPSDTVFEFAWRNRFANVAIIGYKLFWRYLAIANYGSYRVIAVKQRFNRYQNKKLLAKSTALNLQIFILK